MGPEERAVEAVKQWRFRPTIALNGQPVPMDISVEVVFRLL